MGFLAIAVLLGGSGAFAYLFSKKKSNAKDDLDLSHRVDKGFKVKEQKITAKRRKSKLETPRTPTSP